MFTESWYTGEVRRFVFVHASTSQQVEQTSNDQSKDHLERFPLSNPSKDSKPRVLATKLLS
jgi:hypothetical protein